MINKNMFNFKKLLNYLLSKNWILHFVMYFLSDEKKERIYIAKFRAELLFFGHNTVNMTDDEIKDSIKLFGEMVCKCGFTVEQITKAMKTLACQS